MAIAMSDLISNDSGERFIPDNSEEPCTSNNSGEPFDPTRFVTTEVENDIFDVENILRRAKEKEGNIACDQLKRLQERGFPEGLAKQLALNTVQFPLRFWVIDNSGSMIAADGQRLVGDKRDSKIYRSVICTRWKELQETVIHHAELAALLEAPKIFRFLNNTGVGDGSQEFVVQNFEDFERAQETLQEVSPDGGTPLTNHIRAIRERIGEWTSKLLIYNQKVVVVIATDGLPTDTVGVEGDNHTEEFVAELKELLKLPVWLVIRLCTNERKVVDFYNELDNKLEMSIEVIDDLVKEAREIHGYNKWLTYTIPLQRLRESGFKHRLFDLLDERKLTHNEMRSYCMFLFGKDYFEGVPDPEIDMDSFLSSLNRIQMNEKNMLQWNAVMKQRTELINIKSVKKEYGFRGSCLCFSRR